jgi:hypothetical protein
MLRLDVVKAAMRRLSPVERGRLEHMLRAGRSVRSGLGERPKPEPRTRWDDGTGKTVRWGEMKPRVAAQPRREWVL